MDKYQTVGRRFLALIIDFLVMIPVSFLAAFVINLESPKVAVILISLISSIPVFYTILMHAYYGQTFGKMAMKVKVSDLSGQPITFTQSVIRSLPQMLPLFVTASILVSSMPPTSNDAAPNDLLTVISVTANVLNFVWTVADIIVCVSSDKKRALHDFIAGTVVVKIDGRTNLSINGQP